MVGAESDQFIHADVRVVEGIGEILVEVHHNVPC
jgi:hypothetical protein